MSWVLIGLGNPDKEYKLSRHNTGRMFVERIAKKSGVRFRKKELYRIAKIESLSSKLFLLLPETFMNLSGKAVKEFLKFDPIPTSNIIVVFDDMDIPLGEIRIRKKGEGGSHKGVKSIISEISSSDFMRIRIGIGKADGDRVNYVLSPFLKGEIELLEKALDKAEKALELILEGKIEEAMNRFNRRITPCSSLAEGLKP
ncbi:MAG: aminoacyl-tRNA hydrolase [Candidatus Aminicenantia bacterium]